MISGIFAAIQLVLRLFKLWDQFLEYSDKVRLAQAAENTQEREKAVDEQKGASSEEEFDRAQDGVIGHKPK